MKTCETCKWWSEHEWRSTPEECGLVGWNWCKMMQNDYGKETPHPESLAVGEDCESYHATVRTHKNFGCVQHQPKSPSMEISGFFSDEEKEELSKTGWVQKL